MAARKPYLSIVIPAINEEKSVAILHKEISDAVKKVKKSCEIIFVDDGSTDNTYNELEKLHKKDKRVKVIRHRGNWEKAIALKNGFDLSKGEIIITMDADLQDNPKEIQKFLNKIDKGYDLVSGWKKVRHDPPSKLLSTKLYNSVVRKLTKIPIHDINCGFKAYRREVIENIDFYGDLFRLIPVLAHKQNYNVGEVVVKHRARKYGKTKYGIERSYKGMLDLLTVLFLTSFKRKPGHFFGGIGSLSFGAGFLIGLYITYLRFTTGTIQFRQPLLFLGILLMVIGVQLVTTGLLAEMIVNVNQKRDHSKKISNILK